MRGSQDVAVDPASLQVDPDAKTHFAWLRTRLALSRTLMAWVRTATALVGFGFTIVQFFERMSSMTGVRPPVDPHVPRIFGVLLMVVGTTGLATAIWESRLFIKHLWREEFRPVAGVADVPRITPLLYVACSLLLVSIWATCAVLYRLVLS